MSIPRQIKRKRVVREVADYVVAVALGCAVVAAVGWAAQKYRNVGELPAGARCVRAYQEALLPGPQVDGEVFIGFPAARYTPARASAPQDKNDTEHN